MVSTDDDEEAPNPIDWDVIGATDSDMHEMDVRFVTKWFTASMLFSLPEGSAEAAKSDPLTQQWINELIGEVLNKLQGAYSAAPSKIKILIPNDSAREESSIEHKGAMRSIPVANNKVLSTLRKAIARFTKRLLNEARFATPVALKFRGRTGVAKSSGGHPSAETSANIHAMAVVKVKEKTMVLMKPKDWMKSTKEQRLHFLHHHQYPPLSLLILKQEQE